MMPARSERKTTRRWVVDVDQFRRPLASAASDLIPQQQVKRVQFRRDHAGTAGVLAHATTQGQGAAHNALPQALALLGWGVSKVRGSDAAKHTDAANDPA